MKAGRALNKSTLRAHPLPPIIDGDKETKGRLLVIAGCRELPGAAVLAGTAAMRAGAGKLRIATGESVAPYIGAAVPEAMVVGLPEAEDDSLARAALASIAKQAGRANAIVAGPGMKRSELCGAIASTLLESDAAVAFDAAMLHEIEPAPTERRPSPLLLPHTGELAALLDRSEDEVLQDPIGCGLRAADRYRSIVLVKGVVSHVAAPDGDVWTYRGGVPGLGVSGSGDVLAGVVGGLLARGAEPLNALLWAVWLHGEAGARLARKVGPIGFLAREVAGEIPALLPR